MGLLTVIIFTILVYIIINNMSGTNEVGSLPNVTYPHPPHLGLDGVSLENKL